MHKNNRERYVKKIKENIFRINVFNEEDKIVFKLLDVDWGKIYADQLHN